MPRPDFRKLAAERLSTPEPIGVRIGMLLGMSAAEFASSGFSAPADVPFAPVTPAPRTTSSKRKSFAAAVAAMVAEPAPVGNSLPFLSAASPFLSATTVVETPVKPTRPVAAVAVKKAVVKKAVVKKAVVKKAAVKKVAVKKVATQGVQKAAARPAAVTPAAPKRRTVRKPQVAAVAPVIPVELPESAILAGLATATPALPVVSGPSPVADLTARATRAIAGVRRGAKTGAVVHTVADRDTVMEAFADELSRLVELLGAPDGRPDDEHERAKVRKFLQISRIYLDNLAVRMK